MYASILAFAYMCIYYLLVIRSQVQLGIKSILSRLSGALKASGLMLVVDGLLLIFFKVVIGEPNRLGALVELLVLASVGAIIYLAAIAKGRQLDVIIGQGRAQALRNFFHIG